MVMTLKQAAIALIARWKEQEHIPEIICRLDDAVLACNPLDHEVIEAEYFSEEGSYYTGSDSSLASFIAGVRFAERIHGVTDSCNDDK